MTIFPAYRLYIFSAIIVANGNNAFSQEFTYNIAYTQRGIAYYMPSTSISYNNSVRLANDTLEDRRYCRIDINGLFEPGRNGNGNVPFEVGNEIVVRVKPSYQEENKFDYIAKLPQTKSLVYEYRCNAIIPCRTAINNTRITPIPGLIVLKYTDYWYQPNLPQVYNRPHQYSYSSTPFKNAKPPVPNIDSIHDQDLDMNDESVVPHARSPRYIPFDRKPPPADKLANRRIGDHLYAGYFNQYGCFLWNARTDPIPLKDLKPEEVLKRINVARIDEPVYEFRSGSLVRGVINHDYYFVPEIGSTIESFRDYRQGINPRRIYNLPGKFVDN